jgi:acetylornithine deacetylase/succinyl-diaminopimelate desuccinylase-like protein
MQEAMSMGRLDRHRSGLLAAVLFLVAAPASSQMQTPPTSHPLMRAALDSIQVWQGWTLQQQIELTQIEAPPFMEETRAQEFRRRLMALGYQNVRIDAEGNVIAERPGTAGGPVVVVSGHLDTVFPQGTDVRVRREGNRLTAPGIGDDGRGLAVVLTVARAFQTLRIATNATVLFIGTVGEEGQGNLRGVRHLFEQELAGRVGYFISVDGTGDDIVNAAVGSNRYKVVFKGPGGHSYGAFGMPNPAHALGRAVAAIADLQVPAQPKTTFSVSVLSGGTSVNSIPFEVAMEIDMRSEEPAALADLDGRFRAAVAKAVADEKARWPRSNAELVAQIDTIGIRPAGAQPVTAPIVVAALAASRALGLESTTEASSTDSNIPMSMGIPSITIDGGGRGGASHAPEEWYEETPDSYKGPQWAALIVAMLAGLPLNP